MNQSKVLKVITAASLAAALSVAFTACGDESSSTSPEPTVLGDDSSSSAEEHPSSSEEHVKNSSSSEKGDVSSSSEAGSSAEQSESSSSAEPLSKVKAFSAECKNKKKITDAAVLEPEQTNSVMRTASATRTIAEDGSVTITIDDVQTDCGAIFETPDVFESGDTLYVNSEVLHPEGMTNCICPNRISLKLEDSPRFSKAKALVFNNEFISSLEEPPTGSTLTVSSVSGVCLSNEYYDPETDGAVPPVAYMSVDSDSATFVLERVKSSCEFLKGFASTIERPITSGLEITVSGDTLYVKPENLGDSQIDKDCICPSRIAFKVKADSSIANTKIIVVDDDMNRGNRLRVINAEEQTKPGTLDPLKQYGLSRGTCMDKGIPEKRTIDGLPEADLVVYENGLAVLDLNYVQDYCDVTAKVSQKVVNDTLFLDYYDITSASKCLCTFDSHRFELDLESTGASYVMFKDVLYYLVHVTYTKIPNWEP